MFGHLFYPMQILDTSFKKYDILPASWKWIAIAIDCSSVECIINVLVGPDEPEPGVRHLDAPEARLLQLPVDSSELVPETLVSENQSESGSKPPDICWRGIQ